MTRTQAGVALGMAAGLAWTALLFWFGPAIFRPRGDPLAVAAATLILPALAVILPVARVAAARFFDPAIIDGADPPPGSAADAANRVLRNSAEQALLAALVWPALAVMLPPGSLGLVPALGCGFLFARLVFWAGYRRGAVARSFGFAASFYPNVAAAAWALWLFARGLH
ncbi:MAG: hypothetical protein KatS3mg118_2705 [Paracoccaceae bacterium]|nr:MAG: hypothetical protein KatS3mg118_2705 [Paracoccaceae bacterium]